MDNYQEVIKRSFIRTIGEEAMQEYVAMVNNPAFPVFNLAPGVYGIPMIREPLYHHRYGIAPVTPTMLSNWGVSAEQLQSDMMRKKFIPSDVTTLSQLAYFVEGQNSAEELPFNPSEYVYVVEPFSEDAGDTGKVLSKEWLDDFANEIKAESLHIVFDSEDMFLLFDAAVFPEETLLEVSDDVAAESNHPQLAPMATYDVGVGFRGMNMGL